MISLQKLAKRHEVIMYMCAMLSFLTVATGGMNPIMIVFFLLCFLGSWFLGKRTAEIVPVQVWNAIILATVALTGAQMYLSDESVIDIGVRFILFLIMIKLFSRKGGERDDWQIYALTFLLMAAGTAVNEDVAYGIFFTLYVFAITFGLALFHMHTEAARLKQRTIRREGMARVYQLALVLLAGTVLTSSVAIFFVFPRVGLGFFAPKSRAGQAMTGFSDKVELGSHGVIRDNPEVVLRVEFDDNKMPPGAKGYHWRMISFDTYDGVKWERSIKGKTASLRYDSKNRTYNLSSMYHSELSALLDERDAPTTRARVYMEPLGVTQGPQIWPMRSYTVPDTVSLPFNPKAIWLRYDSYYQDLYIQQRNEMGTIFELAITPEPDPSAYANELFDENDEYEMRMLRKVEPFLQLPEGMTRMRKLAGDVTKGANTPYEKAIRIRDHLQTSYEYTTNLPPVDKNNPVEGFLFDSKKGHCEFFATSMALMLRASGVHARVVNGFLGGVWNPSGSYMAVRQGDAHAWVEVYLPTYGWVPFDPTPAAGMTPVQPTGFEAQLRDLYDAARMSWMRYVIEYDLDSQLEGLRKLNRMFNPRSKSFLDNSESKNDDEETSKQEDESSFGARDIIVWGLFLFILWRSFANGRKLYTRRPGRFGDLTIPVPVMIGVWAAFWAGLGAVWLGYSFDFEVPPTAGGGIGPLILTGAAIALGATWNLPREARARGLFADLERAMIGHGVDRRPDEGPSAFIARSMSALPAQRAALAKFRDIYLRARFGGKGLSPEDEATLRDIVRAIRRAKSRAS